MNNKFNNLNSHTNNNDINITDINYSGINNVNTTNNSNSTQDKLSECVLCPRKCKVNRIAGEKGVCRASASVKVSLASLHLWEEPCISGDNGSGTVFFTGCNLGCVFCQNYEISQKDFGKEISVEHLAEIFINLQAQGANNINLVSPTHFAPQIKEALIIAKDNGLNLPVIYNSNGYDSVETLRFMEGMIDIYLPDLKYYKGEYAIKYSGAPQYFDYATKSIIEMYRQVGSPEFSENGLIKKGLIIRHLILPGLFGDTKIILKWISENLPKSVYISLMSQYTPMYQASNYYELNKSIRKKQYEAYIDYFFDIGLENGYVQELSSANTIYTPVFDLKGI